MNDRQYIRSSIGELEAVAKSNWHSLELLQSLAHELKFCGTPRASWLQLRIERRIQELDQARKRFERKSEQAEVKGIVNRIRINSAVLKSLIKKTVKETIQRYLDQKAIKAETARKQSLAQIDSRKREAGIKAEKVRKESRTQDLYYGGVVWTKSNKVKGSVVGR